MSSTSNAVPHLLYHGSAFNDEELMPGYKRTGILVEWDETESNKFLYATTSKKEAIKLGLASSIEKTFKLNKFKTEGDSIFIVIEGNELSYAKLCKLPLYVYTIRTTDRDGWVANNNEHNNMSDEWKTDQTIRGLAAIEHVDIKEFFKDYRVEIQYVDKRGNKIKPTFMSW